MALMLDLPPQVEAALRAEADALGQPPEQLATETVVRAFSVRENSEDRSEIGQPTTDFEFAEHCGNPGLTIEETFAVIERRFEMRPA